MSQNIEIVRRVYSLLADLAAFRRGDYDDVFLDYFSPDHELIPPPIYPDTPSFYRGLEGVHQFLRLMDEVWVDWGFEAERLFDRGDRVVVFVRTSGTARQSGATVEIPAAHVLTVRDRRVTRTEAFLDRQEGLEAARLGKRRHDVPRSTCDSGPLRHSWLMASANLDLVRSILAAWERGDYSSADWAHPEIEYVIRDGPAPGSWTGLAGLAEGWRGVLSAWEELRIEPTEYRELDGERVLVLNHFTGRGKTSGLEVGQTRTKAASLFHVRGGKVTRLVQYWDHERALGDLDLIPDGDTGDS